MVLMNYTKIVYILVVVSIRIGGVMGHQIVKKYNALKEKYTNGLNFYLINKVDHRIKRDDLLALNAHCTKKQTNVNKEEKVYIYLYS